MRALLYIKGLKEPKELSWTEGKVAEDLILNKSASKDTPFSVQGVWTGTKGEMKFIDWQKERVYKEEPREIIKPRTLGQQVQHEKDMQKHREEIAKILDIDPSKKEQKKPSLLRSELNKYKKTHGKDYPVPKDFLIIEDEK